MATIYYIDSVGGSNSNSGLSKTLAWASIPGNGTTKSLQPGDRMMVKRGSSWGGLVIGGSSSYPSAPRDNPITVQVDTTWGSGPVSINGPLTVQGQGIRLDGVQGDLGPSNQPIDYILTVSGQTRFTGSNHDIGRILVSQGGGSFSPTVYSMQNSAVRYVFKDGYHNTDYGWQISDENGGNWQVVDVELDHCYSFRIGGAGAKQSGGANWGIGFQGLNGIGPVHLNHCVAAYTAGRCYDFGGYDGAPGTFIHNHCVARNSNSSGFGANGEDGYGINSKFIYNYCLARDNTDAGWKVYEANADVRLNNSAAIRNGVGTSGFGGEVDTAISGGIGFYGGSSDGPGWDFPTRFSFRNCIFHGNECDLHVPVIWSTTGGCKGDGTNEERYCTQLEGSQHVPYMYLDSDYNAFWGSAYLARIPGVADGGDYKLTYTDAQLRNPAGRWAARSLLHMGLACDLHSQCPATPGFNPNLADIANDDFHILPGSSLIDAGTKDAVWA
jgi:hypothetical protein